MTESQKHSLTESLSALVDGENNELDLRRVLKQSAADDELRETWRRYQLIGAVMRNDKDVAPSIDISASVMAAIADEPAPSVAGTSKVKTWLEGMGKASIAAAVAVGVLVGVQQLPGEQTGEELMAGSDAVVPAAVNANVPDWFQNQPLSARTVSGAGETHSAPAAYASYPRGSELPSVNISRLSSDPELEAYLNRMLEKHAQKAAAENGIKMVPLARASSVEGE